MIGAMRERIKVQVAEETVDSVGGVTRTWTTTLETWARAAALGGRELESAQRISASTNLEFHVRRRTDLTVKMRVYWMSRNWNIHAILHDENKIMTRLLCSEVK